MRDAVGIPVPLHAVRLMPSRRKPNPAERCAGDRPHFFRMRPGLGCLLMCRCGVSAFLTHHAVGTA